MTQRFLVLLHTVLEDPGALLLSAAKRHRLTLEVIPVWKTCIPDPDLYSGLIVLGGNPYRQRKPYCTPLEQEQHLVQAWINHGMPYLGFGYGLQLLSQCFGAAVSDQMHPGVGFATGYLTAAGREHPVFCPDIKQFPIFKWHGHAIVPPVPRSLLTIATSVHCEVEGMALPGSCHILAFQYDNCFASPQDIARLLDRDRQWLSRAAERPIDHQLVYDQAYLYQKLIRSQFNSFFANYLSLL